ncbi:Fe-S cluster assembly sulfur transfer protein SufU [Caldibacillus debilis]|uniref:Fe-S cluster assembly sulfur transfer protein SufU n=1 Tax=Caldibacillus debilis TaxID=301148 RepID=UPI000E381E0C|nr:SUF system NifU family Fe-S cluster assembly protein [Caldibacillus debilis]REJ30715.1 MAG: SUF system NifU family Fe-S cluster assembly protein [Caldibacillus debilis]
MSFDQLETLYRQVIMDHYKRPRNKGVLQDGSLTVDMNNPTCGDRIRLTMKIDGGKVDDVKFEGEGCSISMASASMMTEAIRGKDTESALRLAEMFSEMIQGKDVGQIEALGDAVALQGVAKFPARIKCATLAWKALEKGLKDH